MTDAETAAPAPADRAARIRRMAEQRFREGMALHKRNKLPEAKARYAEALRLRPDFTAVYNNIGAVLNTEGRSDLALPYYRRALAADPDNVGAMMNLARALRNLGALEEAEGLARRVVAAKGDAAESWQLLGLVLRDRRRFEEAIRAFAKMLDLNPAHQEAGFELSFTLLLSGDLKSGFDAYEARWRMDRARKITNTKPKWEGGKLKGATIWVRGEQGFGDAIQFVRYLKRLKAMGAKRVVLETREPLARLMTTVAGCDAVTLYDADSPEHDLWVPLLSLPRWFHHEVDDLPWDGPYVAPPEKGPRFIYAQKGARLAVGLCWAGSPTHMNDKRRTTGLEAFAPVLAEPRACFVSLQKGPKAAQVRELGYEGVVWGSGENLKDFADTASMIASLDLVIAVDTSVVHLAGALGKEVWALIPYSPDWRWLTDRDDTPWYPSVKLYRQEVAGEWAPVFRRVADDLAARSAEAAAR